MMLQREIIPILKACWIAYLPDEVTTKDLDKDDNKIDKVDDKTSRSLSMTLTLTELFLWNGFSKRPIILKNLGDKCKTSFAFKEETKNNDSRSIHISFKNRLFVESEPIQ